MRWNVVRRGVAVPRDFDEWMSAEPVVGEVLALRSFLIDPGGAKPPAQKGKIRTTQGRRCLP